MSDIQLNIDEETINRAATSLALNLSECRQLVEGFSYREVREALFHTLLAAHQSQKAGEYSFGADLEDEFKKLDEKLGEA